MAVDGVINSPSFINIKTIGDNKHYINSNFVVSVSPSKEIEGASDIVMLNGQTYTINDTPAQLIGNRYVRDAKEGRVGINLLG